MRQTTLGCWYVWEDKGPLHRDIHNGEWLCDAQGPVTFCTKQLGTDSVPGPMLICHPSGASHPSS